MRSADLIREARLRAGLTQQELAERSGRERSVIARWEQGMVSPSLENLTEVIRACGFDLPLELNIRDDSAAEQLRSNLALSPERRVDRIARVANQAEKPSFDPYSVLAALERRHVTYIVVGSFARAIRGAEELPGGVDIVPLMGEKNLQRLEEALRDLAATRADGPEFVLDENAVQTQPVIAVGGPAGEVKVVPTPEGTRGHNDLRRATTGEHLGSGLRVSVASTGDLARMLAALGREQDGPKLRALRRLAELERDLGHGLTL